MLLKINPKNILHHSFISSRIFFTKNAMHIKAKKKKKKKSKSSKTPTFPETTIKTLIFCRDVPLYSFNFYKMWSYCTFSEYFLKNKQ